MDQFNQNIYEELLADSRFITWVLGKNEADNEYWEQWKKSKPGSLDQFNEACRTVRMLKFKSPEISSEEISERWIQSKNRMKLGKTAHLFSNTIVWYGRIAGILIIPLLLVTLWFFYNQKQLESDYNQISEYNQKKTIRVVAPLGGQLELELPDGSRAWLNAGSEISYPAFFAKEKREVEMVGEVYFQVARDNKIFMVKNPGPTIKVYGTEFNVHAYTDENEITVALAKGKVALEKNGRELMMAPGEVATFDMTNGYLSKKKSDIYPYVCWREDKYIFRDAPLGTILKTLERRYNAKIHLEDPGLSKYIYNATINGEPLGQILELMTFSAPLGYEYKKQEQNADGSYSRAEVRLWRDTSKKVFKQKK